VRSGPGEARTILLLHIISARPSTAASYGTYLPQGIYGARHLLLCFCKNTDKRHHGIIITTRPPSAAPGAPSTRPVRCWGAAGRQGARVSFTEGAIMPAAAGPTMRWRRKREAGEKGGRASRPAGAHEIFITFFSKKFNLIIKFIIAFFLKQYIYHRYPSIYI
jgi:hypothetical protein